MADFKSLKEKLITRTDLINCLEDLSQVKDLAHNKEGSLADLAEEVVSPPLQEVFEGSGEDLSNTQKRNQFLEDLEDYLEDFDRVRLTLAFSLPRKVLEEIRADLSEEIDSNFIIDLTVDPKIIGGAKLEYQGRYLDFSLSARLDSIFESKF